MENAGVYTLAALTLGQPMSQSLLLAIGPATNKPAPVLDGMTAVTLDVDFKYQSGGSTASAIIVTSLDGGTTWRHIARFDFTTASAVKQCNLEGLLSKAVTAYNDLAAEGVNDGILGNLLAVIVTTTGVYSGGTTLSVRASVR